MIFSRLELWPNLFYETHKKGLEESRGKFVTLARDHAHWGGVIGNHLYLLHKNTFYKTKFAFKKIYDTFLY